MESLDLIFFQALADMSADMKKAQQKKAEDVLKRLRKGEEFGVLAKALSDDKRTKKRGGSSGFFSKGKRINSYGEAFEQKAFSLKVGEISDVFEAKNGFYILKVVEKKEGGDASGRLIQRAQRQREKGCDKTHQQAGCRPAQGAANVDGPGQRGFVARV